VFWNWQRAVWRSPASHSGISQATIAGTIEIMTPWFHPPRYRSRPVVVCCPIRAGDGQPEHCLHDDVADLMPALYGPTPIGSFLFVPFLLNSIKSRRTAIDPDAAVSVAPWR
jgi:hypothetical protein